MMIERDKRTRRGHGVLVDRGGEEVPFRFDASFWDRDRSPGDRVTIMADVDTDEDLTLMGDGILDVRLGRVQKDFAAAQEALAHGDVHRVYGTATPRRWQIEATLSAVHPPEPAFQAPSPASRIREVGENLKDLNVATRNLLKTVDRKIEQLADRPKQVIVMRSDLGMRKGKMIAQGAHASMKVFLDRIAPERSSLLDPPTGAEMDGEISILVTRSMWDWVFGIFTKVCVRADSEAELVEIYEKARNQGLPCAMVEDAGLTEFHGKATKTCCAIGPADPGEIDDITGHLKLL